MKRALLCAGGTGGHLFPAEALAHELRARGWGVELATDARGRRFAETFPADRTHIVDAATIAGRNPVKIAGALWSLTKGYVAARHIARGRDAVVGFGGYPTLPPMLAALNVGAPTAIHEANAVLGRANRLLARRVDVVAAGFETEGAVTVGSPVRPAVLDAAKVPYEPAQETFDLLVFGGSQGARYFAQAVPDALALVEDRARIRLTLQARDEDADAAREALEAAGVEADIAAFFPDMARRIARAHLVVSRAGASTCAELAVIGRPSLLVPFPHALDHDQSANAAEMVRAGAAEIVEQRDLTAERLAAIVARAMASPDELAGRAAAAKAVGRPDAAARLADLVENLRAGAPHI